MMCRQLVTCHTVRRRAIDANLPGSPKRAARRALIVTPAVRSILPRDRAISSRAVKIAERTRKKSHERGSRSFDGDDGAPLITVSRLSVGIRTTRCKSHAPQASPSKMQISPM